MILRAAFFGTPDFAVPSLHAVAKYCDLQCVVCQPDRPAGRGRQLTAAPVKQAAVVLGLPVITPHKMKDGTLREALRVYDLDVAVVVAFGRILPADLLALPRHGCINVHASLLPRWRGAAPIQRAILAGDAETGVTIMQMDEGLDTGPIHAMVTTPIDATETSGQLFARLADLGAQALGEFLARFPWAPPRPQASDGVSLAPPLRKDDGAVRWAEANVDVVNHVRGMDPWPTAVCRRGDEPLKLFDARVSARPRPAGSEPGEVLAVDEDGLHVACADGVVCIGQVQPAGGKRMNAQAYAAGRRFAPGERLR